MEIRKNLRTIKFIRKITTLFLLFAFNFAYAGGVDSDKILEEGKLLYRLERASWIATDLFVADFSELRDSVGGYVSYQIPGNKVNTIFFSRNNPNRILLRFHFSSLLEMHLLNTDVEPTPATETENDLIAIRHDAYQRIKKNEDNFFSFYENTTLNIISVIQGKKKRVIIVTASNVENEIALGNDYVLNYSKKNKFKSQEKIHNSLIRFAYGSTKEDEEITTTMHSHVLSPAINSTDICTLLLYKNFLTWKQHYVISKEFVSIFDIEKETLFLMKRKAWDRMNKNISEKE